jgi:hypothetical protein
MIKTPTSLRRRHFLRGFGGAMLGLPFLESLVPQRARAQDNVIRRFGVFFCCNGVNMERWFPQGDFGQLSEGHLADTAQAPLIPYLGKLLYPRGVHMTPRGFGRDGGGGDDHGKGMAHKLTAQFADDDVWLALGPSVDQVIAAQVNPGTDGARKPPLNLMAGRPGDYQGLGYISYTGAGQAVASLSNPWSAYADLMGMSSGDADGAEASDRVGLRRQSVIDLVEEQFSLVQRGPLSASDRQKLEQHLTAIRALETQITAPGSAAGCNDSSIAERAMVYQEQGSGDGFDVPLAVQQSEYNAVSSLQLDILAMALACDATRVATMQFDNGSGGPTFTWDGMSHEYNHHKLSHGKVRDDCFGESTEDGCADVNGYEQMLFDIDTWHMGKMAHLLERMSAYTEEEGQTLLDNSLVMYTNELADGKGHTYYDLPYVLAGSLAGAFKQGEYVQMETGGQESAPHNKLLNTLVNAMGIASDWFGVPEGEGGTTMQAGVYDQLLA